MQKLTCAITGGSGYVGSALQTALVERGHRTISWSRRGSSVRYELGASVTAQQFEGVDVLIHCAYDFSPLAWRDIEAVNVKPSIELFDSAERAGVKRRIFISSISAYNGCRSLYGRAKLAVEKAVISRGATVIRPGLVYGDRAGGMMGALERIVARAPVVPVIGASQPFHLCHQDDLGKLICAIIEGGQELPTPIIAANAKAVPFSNILRSLARKSGRQPLFVPVPWQLAWLGLKTLEGIGVRAGFRSDSLMSAAYPDPAPDFDSLPSSLCFRPFEER